MGQLESKPAWVDSDSNGHNACDKCTYKTNSEEFLKEHAKRYHDDNASFILYMACTGSIEGRNTLADAVSASYSYIDMTGGQAAFEDGDLQTFGDELVAASRESGYKIYHAYRMHDPGLGLDFPQWWIDTGVALGIFQQYELPEDVKVKNEDKEEDNEDSQEDEASEGEEEEEKEEQNDPNLKD